jgi:hypothetical protein
LPAKLIAIKNSHYITQFNEKFKVILNGYSSNLPGIPGTARDILKEVTHDRE